MAKPKGDNTHNELVRDVMQTNVIMTSPATTLAAAATTMRRWGIGCLPVSEHGAIVGMLTDRDIVVRALGCRIELGRARVADIMSLGVISVLVDHPVVLARRVMVEGGVRRLVVLDGAGAFAGLVSWHDTEREAPASATSRQVVFYRRVCNSHGMPHRVEAGRLFLSPGTSDNAAKTLAIEHFERRHGGAPWQLQAESYEVRPA